MGFLSPMNWVGWTAVLMVVGLAVLAGLADGAHKSIRATAWILAAIIAVVSTYNVLAKGR